MTIYPEDPYPDEDACPSCGTFTETGAWCDECANTEGNYGPMAEPGDDYKTTREADDG